LNAKAGKSRVPNVSALKLRPAVTDLTDFVL